MYATIALDRELIPRLQVSGAEALVVIRFGEAYADGSFFDRVRVYLSREQAQALREALGAARIERQAQPRGGEQVGAEQGPSEKAVPGAPLR